MIVKHNLSKSMSDENLLDVAVDTDTEVEETTNSNESGNDEATDIVEETVPKSQLKQVLARAKKAEDELKKIKNSSNQTTQSQNINNQISPDELKLIARGLSDEEIEQAKVIAKGKGIVLTEAIKDPLFTIYQDDLKEKQRKQDAKLGASKGSAFKESKAEFKPGLTREEHMALWKESQGK